MPTYSQALYLTNVSKTFSKAEEGKLRGERGHDVDRHGFLKRIVTGQDSELTGEIV